VETSERENCISTHHKRRPPREMDFISISPF
jgi:hypothetical protein